MVGGWNDEAAVVVVGRGSDKMDGLMVGMMDGKAGCVTEKVGGEMVGLMDCCWTDWVVGLRAGV